jgi:hypothetical protein
MPWKPAEPVRRCCAHERTPKSATALELGAAPIPDD